MDGEMRDLGEMTPRELAGRLLPRPMADYIVLAHDPRPACPHYQRYVVHGLTSCAEGKSFEFLNLPIEELKAATKRSLLELKEPVWFACDVGQHMDKDRGVLVSGLNDPMWKGYGIDPPTLTKAQKMSYCDSLPTHAMTFTGVDEDQDKNTVKWRVENSWGSEDEEDRLLRRPKGGKGFLAMDDAWFSEYVYEVVVPRSLVPPEILERSMLRAPVPLPLWDPMGSVARRFRRACRAREASCSAVTNITP